MAQDKVIDIKDSPKASQGITGYGQGGIGYGEQLEKKTDAPEILYGFLDSMNVADDLSDNTLGWIGRKVSDEYEIDKSSRSMREERMTKSLELVQQVTQVKNYPFPKASNVIFPLMTNAVTQFAARAYTAIFSSKNIVKGIITGNDSGIEQQVVDPNTGQPVIDPNTGQPVTETVGNGDKRTRADNIAEHMTWQLTEQMPEWEEDRDRLLHVYCVTGCAFVKTYFGAMEGRNVSEMILPKYLIVNNYAKNLESAPRITHEFELYPDEITERMRSGVYREVELGTSSETLTYGINKYSKSGTGEGDAGNYNTDPESPHIFLEQHRILDLDEDGLGEPYVVTVHKETSKVVRIIPRYEREGIYVNSDGEVAKIDPVHYFTKYSFIPSPDGSFYDIGFGDLLFNLNESINSTLNQLLDAGHLANTGGGFVAKGLRLKGGAMRFRAGEWKTADSTGVNLKENIVPIPHAGPSPVLFQLLGLLIESGKEVANLQDVMMGDQAANQAATTTLAQIEQGLTAFKSVYKRFHRSLKQEFQKLYALNSKYLEQEEYFNVLDDQKAISIEDYRKDDVDVAPASDPSAITDMQKLGKAQLLMELMNDPRFDGMEIAKRYLEAANIENIEDLVSDEPPQPNPLVEIETARLENERIKLELEAAKIQIQEKESEAKIKEILAKATKAIAEAEGVEVGQQLDIYKQQLDEVKLSHDIQQQQKEIVSNAQELNQRGIG